jgi:hypothetical protein
MDKHQWTEEEDGLLRDAFGGDVMFSTYVDARVASYLKYLATGQTHTVPIPRSIRHRARKATGKHQSQITRRLTCIVQKHLGLSVDEPARKERRDALMGYALSGVETMVGVRNLDKLSKLKKRHLTPAEIDIAADEMRLAKEEYARACDMRGVKTKNVPWSDDEDINLSAAFGPNGEFFDYMARRIDAYLDSLTTGRVRHMPLPAGVLERASRATNRTSDQVIGRLFTIVQRDLGLSIDESKRGARREVLREYARLGIRTLSGVLQADKAAASPQPTQAEQLPLPAPAARTLDVIAAELREAKHEQVRAEVAASVARSRVEALRAELRAAVEDV